MATVSTRTALGTTGLEVSPVCYGTWQASPRYWGDQPEDRLKQAMRHAYNLGINFFDTADAYGDGRAERLMGEAFSDIPHDDLVIATKLYWHFHDDGRRYGDLSGAYVIQACENSLRRLNMDYIDLYQCHMADPITPVGETIEAMETLVKQGKIRHYGVSNWTVEQLREGLAAGGRFETHQPPYSLIDRDIENDLLPYCRNHNIGVLVYSPLHRGLLSGKYTGEETFDDSRAKLPEFQGERFKQVCDRVQQVREIADGYGLNVVPFILAATLKHVAIDSVITGVKTQENIEESVQAIEAEISREDYYKVRALLSI